MRSFEKVTGPKVAKWLVRTLGGVLAVIGTALVAGSFERRPSKAIEILGLGSTCVLGAADLFFSLR